MTSRRGDCGPTGASVGVVLVRVGERADPVVLGQCLLALGERADVLVLPPLLLALGARPDALVPRQRLLAVGEVAARLLFRSLLHRGPLPGSWWCTAASILPSHATHRKWRHCP